MSVSIYYAARRQQPLSPDERAALDRLIARYSIRDHVEQHVQTSKGHNGENFHLYEPSELTEPSVVFEGATKLPDNSGDALWELIQHWCQLLSEVRRVLPSASWDVHVDDHDITWDEEQQAYDPSV